MADVRTILALSPWATVRAMDGGGGTPVLSDLIESLVSDGDVVHLVLPHGEEEPYTPAEVVLHRVAPRRPARFWATRVVAQVAYTLRLAVAAVRLGRQLRGLRAIYGLSALTIPAAALAGRALGRPTVGVLFGTFFHPALASRKARLRLLEEWLAFRTPVTRLVVLDDGTRGDRVAHALGVPPDRFRFWMHGLDFAACDAALAAPDVRTELGLPAGRPLVVSSSRLAQWKRVDRVVETFALVLEQRPDALLAIAGSGPERARLEKLVRRSGLSGSVVFTGPLPREVSLRLVVAADVVCSFYELSNVGVALLEALACGAAAVVGDTGATADFMVDGRTGILVPEHDRPAAAKAVLDLLADAGRRRELGDEARRYARERFLSKEERRLLELELLHEIS